LKFDTKRIEVIFLSNLLNYWYLWGI